MNVNANVQNTGTACSVIQQSIIARCVSDCGACDRLATGTVVGACVEGGHGSAMAYIEKTCDLATGQLHPMCSQLQLAVKDSCTDGATFYAVPQFFAHFCLCFDSLYG